MPTPKSSLADHALLRAFAEAGDEAAFHALVERYAGLVYGVAMRKTGRSENAEEVAQSVFLVLSRKAGSLGEVRSLAAWLHRATTLEALKFLRNEATRQRHLAMIRDHQDTLGSEEPAAAWAEICPHLDSLLDRLPARDREVLMLHYFEGLPFAQVAARTGLREAAAQKRGARALAKLSRLLRGRGVAATSAVLALGLGAELGKAAPAGFATEIGRAVLGKIAAAGAGLTSASTTTAVTFSAMCSSKLAFAAAFVLAASVPVAREILRPANASASSTREPRNDHPGDLSVPASPAAKPDAARFDPAVFRKALRRLQAAREPDEAEINRLRRLLFTLDADGIAEALVVLEEFEEPEPLRDIVGAAYARWAEIDPEAAVAAAGASPIARWGYYPLNGAWQTWAFSDWDAARAWARNTKTEYDHSFLFWGVLDKLGELDGAQAIERAGQLAADFPERGEAYIKRALASWARHDVDAAVAWMDQNLTEPVRRDEIIGDALEGLGDFSPSLALGHAGMIGNPERLREVRYNIFWQWVLNQPEQAAEYFAASGAGETWDENTVRSAGEGLGRNRPERALEVARAIADPARRDAFYCGILCAAGERDPLAVIEAADAITEEAARTNNSLEGFLRAWSEIDRGAATAWVEALPEGGKKEWARHALPK